MRRFALIRSEEQAAFEPSAFAHSVAGSVKSIAQSASLADLETRTQAAIIGLGFDYYVFSSNLSSVDGQPFCPVIYSLPNDIWEIMFRRELYKNNPVLARLRETGSGIIALLDASAPNPVIREASSILSTIGIRGVAVVPVVSATDDITFLAAYFRGDAPCAGALPSLAMLGSAIAVRMLALHADAGGADLSSMQKEILKWAAAGKSNGDIATIVGITRRGCDYHVSEIYRKLGVSSRAQAVAAFSQGSL